MAVAIAHAACAAALPVLVLVWLFGRSTLHVVWRACRAAAPGAALALVFPALALLGLDGSVAGALPGSWSDGLYLGLAVTLWPSVGGQAVRLLRGCVAAGRDADRARLLGLRRPGRAGPDVAAAAPEPLPGVRAAVRARAHRRTRCKALYDEGYFDAYPGGESYLDEDLQRRYEAARRLTCVLRHRTGGRLLEIGAAAGTSSRRPREAGFEPVGVEPDAELAARGARAHRHRRPRPASSRTSTCPRTSFDVVCAWHVLEHICRAARGARADLRRVLKPSAARCSSRCRTSTACSRRRRRPLG